MVLSQRCSWISSVLQHEVLKIERKCYKCMAATVLRSIAHFDYMLQGLRRGNGLTGNHSTSQRTDDRRCCSNISASRTSLTPAQPRSAQTRTTKSVGCRPFTAHHDVVTYGTTPN